jgi:hypothetical protein
VLPPGEAEPHTMMFVVDTSGSMNSMRAQLKSMVAEIARRSNATRFITISYSAASYGSSGVETRYFDDAADVSFPFFGSGTDFKLAFQAMRTAIATETLPVVYVFLTDGQHNTYGVSQNAIEDTLMSRTALDIVTASNHVDGYALVISAGDMAISNTLVCGNGQLVYQRGLSDTTEFVDMCTGGASIVHDVTVDGQLYPGIRFSRQENGSFRARVPLFDLPISDGGLDIELPGFSGQVPVIPCLYDPEDVVEILTPDLPLDEAMKVLSQLRAWKETVNEEIVDAYRQILDAQVMRPADLVPSVLRRLEQIQPIMSSLTLGTHRVKFESADPMWAVASMMVTGLFTDYQKEAQQLRATLDRVIVDVSGLATTGYVLGNAMMQGHVRDTKLDRRAARKALLAQREARRAIEDSVNLARDVQILATEGAITPGHFAEQVWQGVGLIGLLFAITTPDAAIEDPTLVRVTGPPELVSCESAQVGTLPLFRDEKHWNVMKAGFLRGLVGQAVGGSSLACKSFMIPILYAKGLLATWRSGGSIHHLLALVQTMTHIEWNCGPFGRAVDDLASFRFPDSTGKFLDAVVVWIAFRAACNGTAPDLLLALNEGLRRCLPKVLDQKMVRRSLWVGGNVTKPHTEDEAEAVFLGVGASRDVQAVIPGYALPVLNLIKDALELSRALAPVMDQGMSEMDYEFGVQPLEWIRNLVEGRWCDRSDPLTQETAPAWLDEVMGVGIEGVHWVLIQTANGARKTANAKTMQLACVTQPDMEALAMERNHSLAFGKPVKHVIIEVLKNTTRPEVVGGMLMAYPGSWLGDQMIGFYASNNMHPGLTTEKLRWILSGRVDQVRVAGPIRPGRKRRMNIKYYQKIRDLAEGREPRSYQWWRRTLKG